MSDPTEQPLNRICNRLAGMQLDMAEILGEIRYLLEPENVKERKALEAATAARKAAERAAAAGALYCPSCKGMKIGLSLTTGEASCKSCGARWPEPDRVEAALGRAMKIVSLEAERDEYKEALECIDAEYAHTLDPCTPMAELLGRRARAWARLKKERDDLQAAAERKESDLRLIVWAVAHGGLLRDWAFYNDGALLCTEKRTINRQDYHLPDIYTLTPEARAAILAMFRNTLPGQTNPTEQKGKTT